MFSSTIASSTTTSAFGGGAAGVVGGVQDIFAQVILTILALALIWMGIKTAVNSDKVTEMAFAPFAKFGESVSTMVTQIPSYISTPHPAFQVLASPHAIDWLTTKINTFNEGVDNMRQASAADLFGGASKKFTKSMDDLSSKLQDNVDAYRDTAARTPQDALRILQKAVKKEKEYGFTGADKTEFDDFKKDVEASNGKNTAAILKTHAAIVAKIQATDVGKGIGDLGDLIGQVKRTASSGHTSTSWSNELAGATINASTLEVRTSSWAIINASSASLPSGSADYRNIQTALKKVNGGRLPTAVQIDGNLATNAFDDLFPTEHWKSAADKKIIMKNLGKAVWITP